MKTVSAAEANRQFSRLLHEIREGETFIVTSRGKPVVRMEPVRSTEEQAQPSAREKAKAALLRRLDMQPVLNIPIDWTRDDVYDDDF